jgi:hypothetical protein
MMERGSDKHGPRVDEELHRATEGMERGSPVEPRAEEAREQEGAGDDEPVPDARLHTSEEGEGLGAEDLEARSELARHIEPGILPADREAIISSARDSGASPGLIERLDVLPAGRTFGTVQEIWEAMGGGSEER